MRVNIIMVVLILALYLPANAGWVSGYIDNQKGIKSLGLRHYQTAKRYFESALAQSPTVGEYHFNLGNMFYHQNYYKYSIHAYSQALRYISQDKKDEVLTNLGLAYYKNNHLLDAKSQFIYALQLNPSNQTAKRGLEQILRKEQEQSSTRPSQQSAQNTYLKQEISSQQFLNIVDQYERSKKMKKATYTELKKWAGQDW